MERSPIIVRPEDRPSPLAVGTELVTVLAGADRSGSYEIFLQVGPEDSGAPPHHHPWDEAFYVLRGEVAFGAGELEATATQGTLVHVPAGTTHWFRLGEGGAEMLSVTSRVGAADFFADVAQSFATNGPDFDALVRIARSHDTTVHPPAGG